MCTPETELKLEPAHNPDLSSEATNKLEPEQELEPAHSPDPTPGSATQKKRRKRKKRKKTVTVLAAVRP